MNKYHIKIFLNGEEIEIHKISYNSGMNYGQMHRIESDRIGHYEIRISKHHFISNIADFYNSVRDEIKNDDLKHDDDSPFKESNYKDLADLLYPGSPLIETFGFVERDFLANVFDHLLHDENTKLKGIINSTDSIDIEQEQVIIKGRTFSNIQ